MMQGGSLGGMGFGGFGLGSIFMVLFWVIIIAIGIYLVKNMLEAKKMASLKDKAEDILKKRYASGEITKETYDEMMGKIK